MAKRLWVLAAVLVLCIAAYMTLSVRGSWSFALTLRAEKLSALLIVSAAIGSGTVLFHTVTGNRILTPSIMGFDALYVLILSALVFYLGSGGYFALPDWGLFAVNTGTMVLAAIALFATLLTPRLDIIRMVLTGIILGVLLRGLSALVQRMIDPNEYAIIAANSFASFAAPERGLTGLAGALLVACLAAAWALRHKLDVLALGRGTAQGLGVPPRQTALMALVIIAALTATSTALVGPVAFMGLLTSHIAYRLVPSCHHAHMLPAAMLTTAITLIGGQTVMERVLALATPLSVVVDGLGGLLFLFLVFRRRP